MKYPVDFTTELSKKPICGVLSVAMIAGVTFAQATQAIKNNMMPFQKRHGGKTYHEQRLGALEELGIQFRDMNVPRVTLAHCIHKYCDANRTYMINTSSHVVTVRNKVVADQVEIANIEEHATKRYFVRNLTEIL